jgi:hypothetical protein
MVVDMLNQDNSTLSLLGFSYAAEVGFFVCPRALHRWREKGRGDLAQEPCRPWHHRGRNAVHGHQDSSSTIARPAPMRSRIEDARRSSRSWGCGPELGPRGGAKLRGDPRGRDGGVREELAAGVISYALYSLTRTSQSRRSGSHVPR